MTGLQAQLWSKATAGVRDSETAALTVPSTSSGMTASTAPSGTALAANTSYFVVFQGRPSGTEITTTGSEAARPRRRPAGGRRGRWPAIALAALLAGPAGSAAADEDLDFLVHGVSEIARPGVPGALCVYGPDAFPVVAGVVAGGAEAPVVAAGGWQDGRVVAFGHDGYFDGATLDVADTGRFVANAVRWTGRTSHPRVGVVGRSALLARLVEAGLDAVEATLTPESLAGIDVVAVVMWNQTEPEIGALSSFLRAGGGLVTASTGWGWAQLHPDRDLSLDYAGNRLFRRPGIGWLYDSAAGTSAQGYIVDGPPHSLTHAVAAIDALEARRDGGRALDAQERRQAVATLDHVLQCLPPDDLRVLPRLRALMDEGDGAGRWPSTESPVGRDDVTSRLAAALYVRDHGRTPAESVRAHPAAADFPGAVPPAAARIGRRVAVDTAVPRWHSTGLYAAPGELVTVTVPDAAARSGGLHIRVGAHTDAIWDHAEWRRMPEISRRFAVSRSRMHVANAFGGLIYVEVEPHLDLGTLQVEIQGAVAAPLFVDGETDPVEWREEVRHAPAPWAEIAGRNIVLTTEAGVVRQLDDPSAVAEVWDRVLDLDAELAGWPVPRPHPERFVVDRQLTEGYMHAGYPMMAHLDQKARLVDAVHLRTCRYEPTQSNWGFFHEAGHLHQSSHWTFDGTSEVTVNLFTLYVHEFLCGIPVAENWRGSEEFRTRQMLRHDFDRPDFERWKRDPFLALAMYEQMQQAFGWDAFREVFAEYLRTPTEELPHNDDGEKRDQWLMRFSRTVGHNLGPFFQAWGVPTSLAARDAVAELPVWLPAESQPAHRAVRLGDLGADGRGDVLLRHLDGRWFLYPMAGGRHVAAERGAVDLPGDRAWRFVGVGDFDGAGGDEVLLRHSDGHWRLHAMAGRERLGDATEPRLPRSGQYWPAAVGDFNGDGTDDVLLRHDRGHWRLCPMKGGGLDAAGCLGARIADSLEYGFEGVGDFDGDGNADVLLRTRPWADSAEASPPGRPPGSWLYHPMAGHRSAAPRVWTDLPHEPTWRLAAVGDFDGDGADDALLRHQGSGAWRYYRSADAGAGASGIALLTRNRAYGVSSVGDLDGDGRDDLLLRRNDGAWYHYAMDGHRVRTRGGANLTRNMAWRVPRR